MKTKSNRNETDNAIEKTFTGCGLHWVYTSGAIEQIFDNGYKEYAEATEEDVTKCIADTGADWDRREAELEKKNAERKANGYNSYSISLTTRDFETSWVEACFKLAKTYSIKELAHYMCIWNK